MTASDQALGGPDLLTRRHAARDGAPPLAAGASELELDPRFARCRRPADERAESLAPDAYDRIPSESPKSPTANKLSFPGVTRDARH